MSQENGHGNPTRKDAQLPSTTIQIVITFDQVTRQLNVTGPISDYVAYCGIVEASKDTVRKFIDANQSPIARPGSMLSLQ